MAFGSIIVGIYRQYFGQLLQIRWRTWLTEKYTSRYFSDNRFYHLEQIHGQDNPDQRIADDLNRFTDMAVSLFFGFYLVGVKKNFQLKKNKRGKKTKKTKFEARRRNTRARAGVL